MAHKKPRAMAHPQGTKTFPNPVFHTAVTVPVYRLIGPDGCVLGNELNKQQCHATAQRHGYVTEFLP